MHSFIHSFGMFGNAYSVDLFFPTDQKSVDIFPPVADFSVAVFFRGPFYRGPEDGGGR